MRLNRQHDCYHQVYGELYATGAPWCDFVMWTNRSCLIIREYPNPLWFADSVPKLIAFYENQIITKEVCNASKLNLHII